MRKLTLIMILLLVVQSIVAQITYETVFIDYDSAWTFRNLKVIPVRAKGPAPSAVEVISLGQALEKGMATLSERGTASTENVHWVRIRNHTTQPIFISSGEIITGGRQDRMIAKDTVLHSTGSDQYLPAMCVEEGRWSNKEKKFQYHGFSGPALRKVMDHSHNQVLIWKEVYAQLDSAGIKSHSLAYGALRQENKKDPQQTYYLKYFMNKLEKTDSSILGVICISGNRILGTDIFAANNIFMDESSAILEGYIEEVVWTGTSPTVPDDEVYIAMDPVLKDEVSQDEYCREHGKLFRYKGKVFHLAAYFKNNH